MNETTTTDIARQADKVAALEHLLERAVHPNNIERIARNLNAAQARLDELVGDDGFYDEGPTCSICDAVGHGYPGAGPCPLEVTDYSGEPDWAL